MVHIVRCQAMIIFYLVPTSYVEFELFPVCVVAGVRPLLVLLNWSLHHVTGVRPLLDLRWSLCMYVSVYTHTHIHTHRDHVYVCMYVGACIVCVVCVCVCIYVYVCVRSASSNPLYNPRVKTKAGTRAFSVAAPSVWNSLPAIVKSEGNIIVSFRRRLKTYLFNAAYLP